MAPLVSVVIPTYGRPRYLHEAVSSVLDQTVDDLECIVVDDASPTPVVVPADARVRVTRRTSNGGAAAARNSGLDVAEGDWVTFLDDDDVLTPDRLEIGLRAVERAPVGLCLLGDLADPAKGPGRILDGNVFHTILDGLVPNVGQALVRRDLVLRFDPQLRACEDLDWWLRSTQGSSVATERHVGYLFRHHDGVRHLNGAVARLDHRRALLDKHRAYFEAHPRAEAFQLRRLGIESARVGRRGEARQAFVHAMRRRPSARTAGHLLRTLWPGRGVPSAGRSEVQHAVPDGPA